MNWEKAFKLAAKLSPRAMVVGGKITSPWITDVAFQIDKCTYGVSLPCEHCGESGPYEDMF